MLYQILIKIYNLETIKMAKKLIIDAERGIFGRLCSFAAKKALEGNEIIILNSEKAVISGNKKDIISKYSELSKKGGHSLKGPKYARMSFQMLKRGIRGMLPDFRRGQGKEAFKRVRCYDGIPKEFKDEKMLKISAPKKLKYIELKELAEKL